MQDYSALSAKEELTSFLTRLGKIFSNISIVALLLCLAGILSFVSTAIILLIGLALILLTIGVIFLYIPDYFEKLMKVSNISAQVSAFFMQNFAWFAVVSIIGAVVSLILLSLDRTTRHTGRIVLSSCVIGVVIITVIVFLAGR